MLLKKRIMIFSLVFIFLFGLVMPVELNATTTGFRAGDLVKATDNRAVYYYGYDGKRHAFPNEQTYFSWYTDFKRVKVIPSSVLGSLPLGKNIVVRPGTYLVKFTNNTKIYAVEPMGRLLHILNPSLIKELYGDAWGHRVITLHESLFPDYSIEGVVGKKRHTTGTIFKYKNDSAYYLMTNGYSRRLVSVAKWENYRFNDYFVINLDRLTTEYESGYDIDYFKVSLSDTAQTLIEEELNDYINYIKIAPGHEIKPVSSIGNFVKGGLNAEYFHKYSLNGTSTKRIDKTINFDWDFEQPIQSVPGDFSVRWTGKLEIPEGEGGLRKFYTYSDDGVRLYIDDVLVINNWTDHMAIWDKNEINLSEGLHDIKLEFYDRGEDAVIHLFWNDFSTIIPSDAFYYSR